jgi:hypothetical protein
VASKALAAAAESRWPRKPFSTAANGDKSTSQLNETSRGKRQTCENPPRSCET